MSLKEKIESLGLTLPVAALPIAAYVPAVKTGNLVFVAGQLPLVDGKIVKEGKVGKEVTPEEAKEMAQVCALNALAAIAAADHAGVNPAAAAQALGTFENVKRRRR